MKPAMILFLIDLQAVLEKHSGGFTLSSKQEGILATIKGDWDTKVNIGYPSNGKFDLHTIVNKGIAK